MSPQTKWDKFRQGVETDSQISVSVQFCLIKRSGSEALESQLGSVFILILSVYFKGTVRKKKPWRGSFKNVIRF